MLIGFRCQVSGFGCQGAYVIDPLMKLLESLKANRRISKKKYRMMKCRIASLWLF
ncbi:hypothetical protein D1AOALGA4SA_7387 [Olavius algarvensis Delta 1 endosymbiont]|nr:hypothetical protein D1AOALGA4SA_7387 [Olavius algarvensis Delta 1 endosymbiont]